MERRIYLVDLYRDMDAEERVICSVYTNHSMSVDDVCRLQDYTLDMDGQLRGCDGVHFIDDLSVVAAGSLEEAEAWAEENRFSERRYFE